MGRRAPSRLQFGLRPGRRDLIVVLPRLCLPSVGPWLGYLPRSFYRRGDRPPMSGPGSNVSSGLVWAPRVAWPAELDGAASERSQQLPLSLPV
jgi:hypothetical protein